MSLGSPGAPRAGAARATVRMRAIAADFMAGHLNFPGGRPRTARLRTLSLSVLPPRFEGNLRETGCGKTIPRSVTQPVLSTTARVGERPLDSVTPPTTPSPA